MKSKEQLVEDSLKLAKEIVPSKLLLEFLLGNSKMLSKQYNANEILVLVGLCLMDIKISEARKLNKLSEHVKMASDFAKEYLKGYDLTTKEKDIIINCIEEHHGKIHYNCIESEICANADCYNFIHPVGVFIYSGVLARRSDDFKQQISQLKYKLNEKYNILSLPKAKEELEEYYRIYSKQFDEILNYFDE